MDAQDATLLATISDHEAVSVSRVAHVTGHSRRRCRERLARLVAAGHLTVTLYHGATLYARVAEP